VTGLAPVVLFVYNRPDHTRRTLEALSVNTLAHRSRLTVFCDGPKDSATDEEKRRIDQVRALVSSRNWCAETVVHEREKNLGLARSIRAGIDHVLAQHDRVIVLEDDIQTSPGFLAYMNDALDAYKHDERVMHIAAYLPRTSYQVMVPESFLSIHMSCWGWGTWRRAWAQARWDPAELLREIVESEGGRRRFDLGGTAKFSYHLEANVTGQLHTWAVLWAASIYLADGLCLLPGRSLVQNIGADGTGVHFVGETTLYDVEPADSIRVKRRRIRESQRGALYLRSFFKHGQNSSFSKRVRLGLRAIASRVRARL
jgi:hypothetical protein